MHFRYDGGVSFDEWKANAQGEWEKTVTFTRGHGMGGGIGSIIYAERATDTGAEIEYFVYNAVGHGARALRRDRQLHRQPGQVAQGDGGVVRP